MPAHGTAGINASNQSQESLPFRDFSVGVDFRLPFWNGFFEVKMAGVCYAFQRGTF